MPRKIARRFLPDPRKISESKILKLLGPLIEDPYLFHINRRSISLSFFIGLFCCYLPVPGHTFFAALMALKWRSNLPLAVALIWISNPVTAAPMFLLSYSIGNFLLLREGQVKTIQLSWEWMAVQGPIELFALVLGSLICGLMLGLAGYIIINYLWRFKVIDNWEKRARARALKRASRKAQSSDNT